MKGSTCRPCMEWKSEGWKTEEKNNTCTCRISCIGELQWSTVRFCSSVSLSFTLRSVNVRLGASHTMTVAEKSSCADTSAKCSTLRSSSDLRKRRCMRRPSGSFTANNTASASALLGSAGSSTGSVSGGKGFEVEEYTCAALTSGSAFTALKSRLLVSDCSCPTGSAPVSGCTAAPGEAATSTEWSMLHANVSFSYSSLLTSDVLICTVFWSEDLVGCMENVGFDALASWTVDADDVSPEDEPAFSRRIGWRYDVAVGALAARVLWLCTAGTGLRPIEGRMWYREKELAESGRPPTGVRLRKKSTNNSHQLTNKTYKVITEGAWLCN